MTRDPDVLGLGRFAGIHGSARQPNDFRPRSTGSSALAGGASDGSVDRDGWQVSSLEACAGARYRDPVAEPSPDDFAACARAVACVSLRVG